MSGLEELVHHYYFDENYNCAETIIHAANDYYHLDVKQEDSETCENKAEPRRIRETFTKNRPVFRWG